jgi:SAM-dependent methyltransferase
MSTGGPRWSASNSRSWADLLGLVEVPLFGVVPAPLPGDHILLQDGVKASFVFHGTNADRLDVRDEPLSWSWSSNIRHHLIIDEPYGKMILRRWDRPGEARQFKVPARGLAAEELLALIEESPAPKAPDVIRHTLQAFRLIREALRDRPLESLKILNAYLLAAESIQHGRLDAGRVLTTRTFGELATALGERERALAGVGDLPEQVRTMPAGVIANYFLDPEPRSGCRLHSSLLFRHAASQLYQEAHLQIERDPQGFFAGFAPTAAPTGFIPKDVRYTPVNLARSMVQQAIRALDIRDPARPLVVLDPACGSGIFLQECLRELARQGHIGETRLSGYDISPIANYIARFSLAHALADIPVNVFRPEIREVDALEEPWEAADLVLMNPPFIAWRNLDPGQRESMRRTLGGGPRGYVDLALAFLLKAVQTLRPGGVVVSLLPSSLLWTESGAPFRDQLLEQADLVTIGKFEGFTYFSTSAVEPSFVVLRKGRQEPTPPTKVLIAEEGYEDKAIRLLRLADRQEVRESAHVEVFNATSTNFRPRSWLPERKEVFRLRAILDRLRLNKLGDLFDVHQGVRTGDNATFIISANQHDELPEQERDYFRPVAGQGTLRHGQLFPSYFVFYPYSFEGPRFQHEDEVVDAVPTYFTRWLRDRKAKLEKRASIAAWYLPTRPGTWQYEKQPKLATTYFASKGSFAYDDSGDYVVVQGFAWLYKAKLAPRDTLDLQRALHSTPLPWAYVTLLNSALFEEILSCYCPSVQGGQFDLSNRFVRKVPIPNLRAPHISASLLKQMADVGQRIHDGELEDCRDEANSFTHRAYGLPENY